MNRPVDEHPSRLVTPIAGGYLLIGPAGSRIALDALRRIVAASRHDGVAVSRDGLALIAALEVSIEQGTRTFVAETAKVSPSRDPASSQVTRAFVLVDPVGVPEAARLLRCSEQWMRALCRRGEIVSARSLAGCWWMERDEVAALATGRSAATETRREQAN